MIKKLSSNLINQIAAGEVVDESATISDDVIKEGTMFEDTIAEFGKTKKADGGIARMLGE